MLMEFKNKIDLKKQEITYVNTLIPYTIHTLVLCKLMFQS